MNAGLQRLWQLFDRWSPFRAIYVENGESLGAWTPWGAVALAREWKHEQERRWEAECGRFEATAFGLRLAEF